MDLFHFFQHPVKGPPSHMGWLVTAYLVAGSLCLLAAIRSHRAPCTTKGSPFMWMGMAALMGTLLLVRVFDLPQMIAGETNHAPGSAGFPAFVEDLPKSLLLGLFAIASGTAVLMGWFFKDFWRKHIVLIAGLCFLLTLCIVQAAIAPFHSLIQHPVGDFKLSWILELTGISIICLAAFMEYQNPSRASMKRWHPAD